MTHRRKRKSPDRKRIFLEEFSKVGVLSAAADKAGIPLKTLSLWFRQDNGFREDFLEAKLRFHDHIEKEIVDRIHKGANGGLLRLKAQAEIPEKYGRKQAQSQDGARLAWDELARKAREANDAPPS